MRIIAGIGRGMQFEAPPGNDVRPTPDRSREALFDSLGKLEGKVVYDLCAGSGALGLEAASRGAAAVFFVENSKKHCKYINAACEQLKQCGVTAELKVSNYDVLNPSAYILKTFMPDIVFVDPPYADSAEYFSRLSLDKTFVQITENSLIVWELPSAKHGCDGFADAGPWMERRFRRFGGVNFMLLKQK